MITDVLFYSISTLLYGLTTCLNRWQIKCSLHNNQSWPIWLQNSRLKQNILKQKGKWEELRQLSSLKLTFKTTQQKPKLHPLSPLLRSFQHNPSGKLPSIRSVEQTTFSRPLCWSPFSLLLISTKTPSERSSRQPHSVWMTKLTLTQLKIRLINPSVLLWIKKRLALLT